MIANRISPELKNKFKDAISKTSQTGLEHGFVICRDENEKLTPGESCTEAECGLVVRGECPFGVQGIFHANPDIELARGLLSRENKTPSTQEIMTFLEGIYKKNKLPMASPSHKDLLNAIVDKCEKRTKGTVCVGSDATPDRVECWTVKFTNPRECARAKVRSVSERGVQIPLPWIRSLFDRDTIDLK